jgi:histidinol-phosphate aminotransferase
MSTSAPEPYIPPIGVTVVRNVKVGRVNRVINLSLNESAIGASPRAMEAAVKRAQTLERYPDAMSTSLRRAIGRVHDLDPDRIICGNGSEELLDVIGRVYARPGDEILYPEYGFLQFAIVTMRVGATAVTAPEHNLHIDVDAILDRVTDKTKIVFVANPNNPTGTVIPMSEFFRLRDALPPSVVFVFDAAYAEYVDDDELNGFDLADGVENTIITRTFSKAYGLACARVGWAYGPASMIQVLNRMRGIGNVNGFAQEAALAALDDRDFVVRVREETSRARAKLTESLRALGLFVLPSEANFVMADFTPIEGCKAADALKYLAARGIITRDNDDYGLGHYLRITIGKDDENRLLVDALRDYLSAER